jgi:dUTP pyrophosphatase
MKVKLLASTATAPERKSEDAAGYDLYCSEHNFLMPNTRKLISTGISLEIPKDHYGRIAPRSGLAVKNSIDIGAGVVDSDYRGEVKILLINNSQDTFWVNPGDRIAQLILVKISLPEIEVVEDLSETSRGEGGFGSTGKK